MKNPKTKFKNDKYKAKREGSSRLLDISCGKCGKHLCYYQKDGPGILLRMYKDRMFKTKENLYMRGKGLKCKYCSETIAFKTLYKKEKRPAFRLFPGSIAKKITKSAKA